MAKAEQQQPRAAGTRSSSPTLSRRDPSSFPSSGALSPSAFGWLSGDEASSSASSSAPIAGGPRHFAGRSAAR